MRRAALAAAAALLAAALAEGCAVEPGSRAGQPKDAAPVPAAPAPPPLLPLERLPPTARTSPQSTVAPVVSDGSVDPDEDSVEPGMDFERGGASWYGSRFHGRRTASGERFDVQEMTAAHRTLPFGTLVCVRNVGNGRAVLVRVNDRGPSARNRVIDISQAAAEALAMVGAGVQTVALSRPVSGRMRCE